ncbi:MAG: DUF4411 family protein [Nitrospirota bacterium]
MIYFLDANVLIDANRDYYRIGSVDEFWEWLLHHGEQGNIKIPEEIYEEIKAGNDDLAAWVKESETEAALKLSEEVDIEYVQQVTREGYGDNLSDIDLEKIERDPFLIAYALVNPAERIIVTTEHSKPTKQGANRHIPDVSKQFGIQTINTYELTKILRFSTKWKAGAI